MSLYRTIKNLWKRRKIAFRFLFDRDEKITIIFNYHRIGDIDSDNPFHRLHTVSLKNFKRQVKLMKAIGKIVSLDEVYSERDLSKFNFSITFDDISYSALNATSYLESNDFPWAWGPSVEITDQGLGWRDKVYFILSHYSESEIFELIRETLGDKLMVDEKDFSFYHFSKSDLISSVRMEKIINKLFEPIKDSPSVLEYLHKKNYLSWKNLNSFYSDKNRKNHLATLMSHSMKHYNMSTLSRSEIFKDVDDSSERLFEELGRYPKFYAVPFGAVQGDLLVDLNDSLAKKNFKGALWVTNSANISFKRAYPNYQLGGEKELENQNEFPQLLHLARIHTPERMLGFLRSIIVAIIKTSRSIVAHAYLSKEETENSQIKVIHSSDHNRSLQIENLLRYGKDYSSSKSYYDYSFTNNVFKNNRPDYYCIESSQRVESIGYNFHMRFRLKDNYYDGIYWAGWRKLPFKETNNHSMLLLKAMKEEPIIGSYKPNDEVAKAFQSKNWRKVKVNTFHLSKLEFKEDNDYNFRIFKSAPKVLDEVIEKSNSRFLFSIARSREYYQWRYDSYKNVSGVSSEYHVMYERESPVGFIVLSSYKGIKHPYFLSDYLCDSDDDFYRLCSNVNYKIILESSSDSLGEFLRGKHPESNIGFFHNYYYFNNKYFRNESDYIDEIFNNSSLQETQTTGDLLLR